jgi:peptidoglycan/LPS O-acetylase OafA/YrhL
VPPAERLRIPEIDGIRGLAILLVLLWHYFNMMVHPAPGTWVWYAKVATQLGWSGVDLFFVLSGFLLGGILLENRESPNYFKTFYARRAFRILPIYFAVVLAFAILLGILQDTTNEGIKHLFRNPMPLWSYLTFTQNFTMLNAGSFGAQALSVTWSLAVEEQFYLFLPLLIYFVPRRVLPGLLILLIVAAPISRGLLWSEAKPGFAGFVLMPGRADALLLGVLGALAIRAPGFVDAFARHRVVLALVFFVLFCGMAALACFGLRLGLSPFVLHVAGQFWIASFYAMLVLWVSARPTGALGAVMRFRPLRSLGLVSYAVYLFHMPVLGAMFALVVGQQPALRDTTHVLLVLVSLVLTLGLAALSWSLFEKPLLRLGHRFKY